MEFGGLIFAGAVLAAAAYHNAIESSDETEKSGKSLNTFSYEELSRVLVAENFILKYLSPTQAVLDLSSFLEGVPSFEAQAKFHEKLLTLGLQFLRPANESASETAGHFFVTLPLVTPLNLPEIAILMKSFVKRPVKRVKKDQEDDGDDKVSEGTEVQHLSQRVKVVVPVTVVDKNAE